MHKNYLPFVLFSRPHADLTPGLRTIATVSKQLQIELEDCLIKIKLLLLSKSADVKDDLCSILTKKCAIAHIGNLSQKFPPRNLLTFNVN